MTLRFYEVHAHVDNGMERFFATWVVHAESASSALEYVREYYDGDMTGATCTPITIEPGTMLRYAKR